MELSKQYLSFLLLLILTVIIDRSGSSDAMSPHCDATTLRGTEINRNKLKVWKVNDTSIEEPYDEYQRLDICLSNGSLRINWTMNPTRGNELKLCYDVKRVRNMNILITNCFMVHVPHLHHKTQVYCWFGMENIQKEPYIHALVTQEAQYNIYYYEYIYTTHKDITKDCDHDICYQHVVQLKYRVILCGGTNRIQHEDGVSIDQLTFSASNSTQCQNIRLVFSRVTEREVEFTVNCTNDGLGRIYLVYTVRGKYCHTYFETRVSCATGTLMQATPQPSLPPKPKYHEITLMATFIVVTVIIISVSVGGVLVIRRRRQRDRHQHSGIQVLNNRNESKHLSSDNDAGDVEENNMLVTKT
ncbi:uncharacterized protein LOC123537878 [Mercenaria mercenaria]|uniref:uncharacterized protein LOC123537878 n=1 Tax=Mercenaria mercenaria TaxID=6596 RepID=UPI00234EF471|nr:uncharacterized protein LOC123537878 [Mercenaria mercenaria]